MATDNLQALFGGTMLPEEMQQQLLNQRAREFATLTPSQQLGVMGYKAGAGLGQGLAQAMGVDITDPAIKRMSTLRALSQGVENTSEGMMQFAQKLRDAGFPTEAAQAMDKAREIAATEAGTKLKGAQAVKAENFEAARTDSEKKRTLLADVEQSLANKEQVDPTKLNQARLAWAQETRPKTFQQPDGSIATVPGVDANLFPNLNKALTVGGAGGVSKAGTIETPASKEAAQVQAEAAQETVATVTNSMQNVKDALDLYNTSKTAGGYGQFLANLPNTDAKALSNFVSAIKSAFSVEEISKLKTQSKTGATGFGSLAVKELETIQNAATALDPADKNFPKQLKIINDSFDRWKKLMEQRGARAEAKISGGATPTTPTNTDWQNPQGKEGQLAILKAELAKAQQLGNEADVAGLTREISRLGGQSVATPSTGAQGGWSIKRK